mmetsp:Transcript_16025/g.35131  ORF Transcript_16025/g.35131 Transcript_16025/m.35131 type:complete len:273 (+) Transcript_16025:449-1267(+)
MQRTLCELLAALCEDHVLVRPQLRHQAHILKTSLSSQFHQFSTPLSVLEGNVAPLRPRLEASIAIPVIAQSPDIPGRLWVSIAHRSPLEHSVAVVVPDDDSHICQARALQRWAQVVSHEIALLFGRIKAGLPGLCRLRFILDRHAPDVDPGAPHLLDEPDVVQGPGISALFPQPPIAIELAIRLHPRWRAPRACEQRDVGAGHFPCSENCREDVRAVAIDIETSEVQVALCNDTTGPIPEREVTRANRHTPECVANSYVGVKVRPQDLLSPS